VPFLLQKFTVACAN